jgi:hypothetical protein
VVCDYLSPCHRHALSGGMRRSVIHLHALSGGMRRSVIQSQSRSTSCGCGFPFPLPLDLAMTSQYQRAVQRRPSRRGHHRRSSSTSNTAHDRQSVWGFLDRNSTREAGVRRSLSSEGAPRSSSTEAPLIEGVFLLWGCCSSSNLSRAHRMLALLRS